MGLLGDILKTPTGLVDNIINTDLEGLIDDLI